MTQHSDNPTLSAGIFSADRLRLDAPAAVPGTAMSERTKYTRASFASLASPSAVRSSRRRTKSLPVVPLCATAAHTTEPSTARPLIDCASIPAAFARLSK